MAELLDAILVVKGAELRAVQGGLAAAAGADPELVPLPIGPGPVRRLLGGWRPPTQRPAVLVAGLCGGLSPWLGVGDSVVYRSCLRAAAGGDPERLDCDRALTAEIKRRLGPSTRLVSSVTRSRPVVSAAEKKRLAAQWPVDVVDMEGFAVLQALAPQGARVAMLRVVSDDSRHDLPDISAALSPEGELLLVPLCLGLLRRPLSALLLIRGYSLGLRVLGRAVTRIMTALPGDAG